ncbi:MAG: hypothetical protein WC277_06595 [Bacilli bacterium]|jgi:hypothetical protein
MSRNTKTLDLPGERVTFRYEDTGTFWKIAIVHEYPEFPGFVEEIITTPEILNRHRLYFVSVSLSPNQTAIPNGSIPVSGNREFVDVEEFADYLIEDLYVAPSNTGYPLVPA